MCLIYLDNKLTLNFPIYSFGPLCSYFTVIITPFQNLLAVISRGKRLISFGGLNSTILESMSLTCLTAYLRDGTGRVSKDVTICVAMSFSYLFFSNSSATCTVHT